MTNRSQIEGGWNDLKGKVKAAWGQISDDTLREFEGDCQQLISLIQQQTGQTQEQIEQQLADLDARFRPMLEHLAATARQYYEETIQATGDTMGRVRDQVAAGQAHAEHAIQRRPLESVVIAFGTGIVAGVVLGLISRSR